MTKEIHDINTRALDFVVELIDYIFEYPDDDYMTMECLCRKLVKHGLLDKADGYYQTHDKTEPQTDWHYDEQDATWYPYKHEDEPQTIRALPSEDRPQGEWIDEADEYDASFGIHDYRCSNCNSYADEYIGGHEWYTAGKPNFCPYCGADMREREGE